MKTSTKLSKTRKGVQDSSNATVDTESRTEDLNDKDSVQSGDVDDNESEGEKNATSYYTGTSSSNKKLKHRENAEAVLLNQFQQWQAGREDAMSDTDKQMRLLEKIEEIEAEQFQAAEFLPSLEGKHRKVFQNTMVARQQELDVLISLLRVGKERQMLVSSKGSTISSSSTSPASTISSPTSRPPGSALELRMVDCKLDVKHFSQGYFQSNHNPRTFRRELKAGVQILIGFSWEIHGYVLLQKCTNQSMAHHIQEAMAKRTPCLELLDQWCLVYLPRNLYGIFEKSLEKLSLLVTEVTPYDWIQGVNGLLSDHVITLNPNELVKIMKRCDDTIRQRLSHLRDNIPVEMLCQRPDAWNLFQAELVTVLQQISEPSNVKSSHAKASKEKEIERKPVSCTYCSKAGHIESDCHKKRADAKSGSGKTQSDKSKAATTQSKEKPKEASKGSDAKREAFYRFPPNAGVCFKCGKTTAPLHGIKDCPNKPHGFSASHPYEGSSQEKANIEVYATIQAEREARKGREKKKTGRVRVQSEDEELASNVEAQMQTSYRSHYAGVDSDTDSGCRRVCIRVLRQSTPGLGSSMVPSVDLSLVGPGGETRSPVGLLVKLGLLVVLKWNRFLVLLRMSLCQHLCRRLLFPRLYSPLAQ